MFIPIIWIAKVTMFCDRTVFWAIHKKFFIYFSAIVKQTTELRPFSVAPHVIASVIKNLHKLNTSYSQKYPQVRECEEEALIIFHLFFQYCSLYIIICWVKRDILKQFLSTGICWVHSWYSTCNARTWAFWIHRWDSRIASNITAVLAFLKHTRKKKVFRWRNAQLASSLFRIKKLLITVKVSG